MTIRKWSTQATSFRPIPFHANYFLNVYNMSSMHLNKILFKRMTIKSKVSSYFILFGRIVLS